MTENTAGMAAEWRATMLEAKLNRWARREGTTVEWGNVIGGYRGQEFREIFGTVADARKRERQANAGKPIGEDRQPVALKRVILH